MLAAKGLSAVLDDFHGVVNLQAREIWVLLGAMVLAVFGRYIFSYLRAKTQESVGYEATADERIQPVSYTHLDVYKRQPPRAAAGGYGRHFRRLHV